LLADVLRAAGFAALVIIGVVMAYDPLHRFAVGLADGPGERARAYASGLKLAVVLFVVTVVGLPVARLAWRAISLRHHHYRVTNQRLTVETGVIAKSLVEVDMRTVDDITFNQGVIERLLKLGRIEVISSEPGGAAGRNTHLALMGISQPRAVRETIRNAAYQATHGQLFTRST
jgi:membrane protein YdbS with pleckstrin-like domain